MLNVANAYVCSRCRLTWGHFWRPVSLPCLQRGQFCTIAGPFVSVVYQNLLVSCVSLYPLTVYPIYPTHMHTYTHTHTHTHTHTPNNSQAISSWVTVSSVPSWLTKRQEKGAFFCNFELEKRVSVLNGTKKLSFQFAWVSYQVFASKPHVHFCPEERSEFLVSPESV